MSKHTPGPWKVIRDGNDLSVRSANSRDTGKITHLDIAENIGGLRPGPDFTDRSEAEANARLIAASPTMFDYIIARSALGDAEACAILESINAAR